VEKEWHHPGRANFASGQGFRDGSGAATLPLHHERGAARMDYGKRIYLFGISPGGYTVFDVNMFDSQYFTARGVFAAVITPDYEWIVQKATREIPIAIYMGDHDQYFTVAQPRARETCL